MTIQRTLLLSLRPRFAEAILEGRKSIEIRRRPVNAIPGTPIIIYASSPTMAVVGTARLGEVLVHRQEAAWYLYHEAFAVTRAEFESYLDGSPAAYLLTLHRVRRLNEPLPLRDLRQDGPFRPPQSFRYVAPSDPSSLKELVAG